MKVVHLGFNHRYHDIRIFEKECVSLAEAGYEVVYITSNKNSPSLGAIIEKGVKIIIIPLSLKNRYLRMLCYLRDVKKVALQQDADIYHIHEIWFLPLIRVLSKKGKVVYDSHEDAPRDMFLKKANTNSGFKYFCASLFEMYENNIMKKVTGVIAATPYIADRLRKININTIPVCNYPILAEFKPSKHVQEKKERKICYTGGITEINGIVHIIKAMEYIDGELYLAGKISRELEKNLQRFPGWKKIKEYGYVDREMIQNIYQESKVGLVLYLPVANSLTAQPNKMFEYMAAGLPIVASDFPLWKSIVEKEKCGICVSPENIQEISDAINFLLNHPTEAERMGTNGRRAAYEQYNWEIEKKKLIDFYKRIEG